MKYCRLEINITYNLEVSSKTEKVEESEKMEVDDDSKTNSESHDTATKSETISGDSDVKATNETCLKNESSSDEGSSGNAETDLQEIIRRAVGGSKEDDGEEVVHLTADEATEYLLKKIGEYMNSPVNPLYSLRERAKYIEGKSREQTEEVRKIYKALQMLERKQENFLRSIDILPKVTMSHVGVSANLPMEPLPNAETVLKREVSITKVDNPSNKASSNQMTPKAANIECIDLTDDNEPTQPTYTTKGSSNAPLSVLRHPAPLPPRPHSSTTSSLKHAPPKPRLKISAEDRGIVLQWDMPPHAAYDTISTFEIFGYQEHKNLIINTLLWKKIGSVKAMTLPMACTLTQFVDGNKYHFAIRAVDVHGRCGHYSDAISIVYKQRNPTKK